MSHESGGHDTSETLTFSLWQLCLFLLSLSASLHSPGMEINDAALADETNNRDWLAYGRTYSEQRFSPLNQINTKTIGGLKVDWYLDLPDAVGLVATPLVAAGLIYFVSPRNIVHAVSSVDGRQLWSTMTVDPELSLYISDAPNVFKDKVLIGNGGTENGPVCGYVTAYDADTGEYKCHYQTTPGESWDYNSNMDMDIVLADLEIAGKPVKAMMHAPKNGFFYVIDRADGRLISAEPCTEVTCASHVDIKTGRPVEIPGARYEDGSQVVAPGPLGGHNWPPMSYSPQTSLVYIPTNYQRFLYSDEDISGWESPDSLAPVPTEGMGVAFEEAGRRSDGVRGTRWQRGCFTGLGIRQTHASAGDIFSRRQGQPAGTAPTPAKRCAGSAVL